MLSNKITSLANPKIKHVVQLRDSRERKKNALTIIEGQREVSCAFEAKVDLKEIYVCRDVWKNKALEQKLLHHQIPLIEVTKNVFEKISYGDRLDGILAVGQPKHWSLDDLIIRNNSILIVVDAVEKPGNLGAIFRTADAAGVCGVIVSDVKTDLYNPNIIRSSVGTIFTRKSVVCSKESALVFLKGRAVKICAATPKASKIYFKENLTGALAFVVGSEDKGLDDFWIKNADMSVHIPMQGQTDSLNVSVSTAILIYEVVRQRST